MMGEHNITKLCNAIRKLRGIKDLPSNKFVIAPDKNALGKVIIWLGRCGRFGTEIDSDLVAIMEFKTLDDMQAWIEKTFRKKTL